MESKKFIIHSPFKPTGDQPTAIKELVAGLKEGKKYQDLHVARGTGRTLTMANVFAQTQKRTLKLVDNRTWGAQ